MLPHEHFPGFVHEYPIYQNTDVSVFENRKVQCGLSRGAGHVVRMGGKILVGKPEGNAV